jgi:flavin-dependent dehydrogenase
MNDSADRKIYDIAIAGGGLAGLSLAILGARAGFEVVLFEKERYPFHRVCGEYISLESWNFLQDLGVPLSDLQLPLINNVIISAPNGNHVKHRLPLGGFGISRYFLDQYLFKLAEHAGVTVFQNTKVTDIFYRSQQFEIYCGSDVFYSKVAAGAFGKRSNLDVKWKRHFLNNRSGRLRNHVGIKYHVSFPVQQNEIALHNFEEGYCGISQVEGDKQCLCYLTSAINLAKSNNDIAIMERTILMKNPFLKEIFNKAVFLYNDPVTISQIAFDRKEQVEQHVLMIGDSAGMITPLCGNGMSMALHSSKLAFNEIRSFLKKEIDRYEMELQYTRTWESAFANRMRNGRMLQSMFGKPFLTNLFVASVKPFPKLISFLVKQTHGQPF